MTSWWIKLLIDKKRMPYKEGMGLINESFIKVLCKCLHMLAKLKYPTGFTSFRKIIFLQFCTTVC